jgi:hypothetical protein
MERIIEDSESHDQYNIEIACFLQRTTTAKSPFFSSTHPTYQCTRPVAVNEGHVRR